MVTSKQIAMLKFFVAQSRDGNETIKRILFFLIESSQGMTRQVSVCLTGDKDGYVSEEVSNAAHSLDAMGKSQMGTTHLYELMELMDAGLYFSAHYGHYDEEGDKFSTEGQFGARPTNAPGHENDRDNMPLRYTFWLSKHSYGNISTLMGNDPEVVKLGTPSRQALMEIDANARNILLSLDETTREK